MIKKHLAKISIGLILIILSVSITLCLSCISPPTREEFPQDPCYYSAYYLYILAKTGSKDKSVASGMIDACKDRLKELSYMEKIEYCNTKTPIGMTAAECRLYLNQK